MTFTQEVSYATTIYILVQYTSITEVYAEAPNLSRHSYCTRTEYLGRNKGQSCLYSVI